MANYQLLKADIDAKVYQNGQQEITGENLNSVLNAMVTTLGAEYQFAGVATIDTNPGTPDAKVFYIANGKGTYTNFGSLEVTEDEVVVLYWDTAWHKEATGIASQAKLSELVGKVNGKQDALTLTVKDNGNIVIANIQGQSKEFMPATPSGDPMHYAYVAAGAEYNDTGADIVRTTPWADMIDDDYAGDYGKTVVHKAGFWYLNGLGDLTNNDMLNIMQTNRPFSPSLYAGTSHKFKTNICFEDDNPFIFVGSGSCTSLIRNNRNIKVLRLPISKDYNYQPNKSDELCLESMVVHVINILDGTNISSYLRSFNCIRLKTIKIKSLKCDVSFRMVSGLTLKSVLYMINNEVATSPITITLHADVYNRCMANADILAALEQHTNISLASA